MFRDTDTETDYLHLKSKILIKVRILPSKKFGFIFVNIRPLKMIKKCFLVHFLKALFVLKIFKFLYRLVVYIRRVQPQNCRKKSFL